jgi:cysteine desulfurase
MRRVYADHAAATPILPAVLEALLPYLRDRFGDPSGLHARSAAARAAVDEARASVATLLAAPPHEIVFTGSASEANNLAIKGSVAAATGERPHLVAAVTERLSVLHPLRTLERRGAELALLPVDRHGRVDPEDLRRALTPRTILVSVAHASAEIGTVQPIADLCRVAHERGVPLHCDATATAGLLPLPCGPGGPDLVVLASRSLYGPPGAGALRVREDTPLRPLVEGGAQEGGLRAGGENVPALVGFGAAARLALRDRERRAARAAALAGRLTRLLAETLKGVAPTGHPALRIPGLVSVCVSGIDAEAALLALDAAGIEAGSGSACTSVVRRPSHVLEAIGVDPLLARGALTFSFGEASAEEDPETIAAALRPIVARLRDLSPL